jgi:hypothetical protein
LNNKLNLILLWAANEQGFKNVAESRQLIEEARRVVRECALPDAAKKLLNALVEGTASQLAIQASPGNLYDVSRWLGDWRVQEIDGQAAKLTFLASGGPLPSFVKERIVNGTLVERIAGVAVVMAPNRLRLDWNLALATGPGGAFPMAGYSEVTLGANGALHGADFRIGSAAQRLVGPKDGRGGRGKIALHS